MFIAAEWNVYVRLCIVEPGQFILHVCGGNGWQNIIMRAEESLEVSSVTHMRTGKH